MKKISTVVIKILVLIVFVLPLVTFFPVQLKAAEDININVSYNLTCEGDKPLPAGKKAKVWLMYESSGKQKILDTQSAYSGNASFTSSSDNFFKENNNSVPGGEFWLEASSIAEEGQEMGPRNSRVRVMSVKNFGTSLDGKYTYSYTDYVGKVDFDYPKCPAPISQDVTVQVPFDYKLVCKNNNGVEESVPKEANAELSLNLPSSPSVSSSLSLNGKEKSGQHTFSFPFKTIPGNKDRIGVWLKSTSISSPDGKQNIDPLMDNQQIGYLDLEDGKYSPAYGRELITFFYTQCLSSGLNSATGSTSSKGKSYEETVREFIIEAENGTFSDLCQTVSIDATKKANAAGVKFEYTPTSCISEAVTCLEKKTKEDGIIPSNVRDCASKALTSMRKAYYGLYYDQIIVSSKSLCDSNFGTVSEARANCGKHINQCPKTIDALAERTNEAILGYDGTKAKCEEPILALIANNPSSSCDLKLDLTETLGKDCTDCIAIAKKQSIQDIRNTQIGDKFPHRSCNDWQIVNYMCSEGSPANKSECLIVRGTCAETIASCRSKTISPVGVGATSPADTQPEGVGKTAPGRLPGGPGGGGGGGGGREGQPANQPTQAKKEPQKTEIVAHIHGQDSGTVSNIDSTRNYDTFYRVVVGARVTPEGSEACIEDEVSMTMEKVSDDLGGSTVTGADGKTALTDRKITITKEQGNGQKDESLPEGKYQNCQSYWANLKGSGIYKLKAVYPGYAGDEKMPPYLESETEIKIQIISSRAELIPTNSTVKAAASQAEAAVKTYSNQRLSWAKLFGKNTNIKGNVAGVKVENKNGKLVVTSDNNSSGKLILTPQTTLADGTLDTGKIPVVHFTVRAVYNDGSTKELINNSNFPNGESVTFSEEDLNLSRLSHLEASTVFNQSDSEYAPSSGDLAIDVSETKAEEQPWVKLSSDPLKDNISATDNKVTITASTNFVAENPVFEVLHDGKNENKSAVSATANCQDGLGSCEYQMELFQPKGNYKITFNNKGVSDSLEFNIEEVVPEEEKEEEVKDEVEEIVLKYKGDEKPLSLDGGQIPFDLDPGENTFLMEIRYKSGESSSRSFKVIYEDIQEPAPSEQPSSTPENSTEPSPSDDSSTQCTEVRQYNECTACNTSRRISQDSCGNYDVIDESQDDSSCTDGCPAPEPDQDQDQGQDDNQDDNQDQQNQNQNRVRWYCEGDVIMEKRNNDNATRYEDCGEQGKSCRSITTPGYESDAECY